MNDMRVASVLEKEMFEGDMIKDVFEPIILIDAALLFTRSIVSPRCSKVLLPAMTISCAFDAISAALEDVNISPQLEPRITKSTAFDPCRYIKLDPR